MSHEPERLTEAHCFDFFDCGEPELDSWPQKHALEDQQSGRSVTHVWTDDGGEYVVGYFTLLPTVTRAEDGGIFSTLRPNRSQAMEVPGVLIGKMALDQSLRGTGEGLNLLADALLTATEAMMLIGGRHVLVDPMKDRPRLRDWYITAGFTAIDGSDRLYISFLE